nr:MAG TPA: hypothetical protein [Caudoviricetes sp.]
MKAPVGLLSGRAGSQSEMEGSHPDKLSAGASPAQGARKEPEHGYLWTGI